MGGKAPCCDRTTQQEQVLGPHFSDQAPHWQARGVADHVSNQTVEKTHDGILLRGLYLSEYNRRFWRAEAN
jgi:hypothetical protein